MRFHELVGDRRGKADKRVDSCGVLRIFFVDISQGGIPPFSRTAFKRYGFIVQTVLLVFFWSPKDSRNSDLTVKRPTSISKTSFQSFALLSEWPCANEEIADYRFSLILCVIKINLISNNSGKSLLQIPKSTFQSFWIQQRASYQLILNRKFAKSFPEKDAKCRCEVYTVAIVVASSSLSPVDLIEKQSFRQLSSSLPLSTSSVGQKSVRNRPGDKTFIFKPPRKRRSVHANLLDPNWRERESFAVIGGNCRLVNIPSIPSFVLRQAPIELVQKQSLN